MYWMERNNKLVTNVWKIPLGHISANCIEFYLKNFMHRIIWTSWNSSIIIYGVDWRVFSRMTDSLYLWTSMWFAILNNGQRYKDWSRTYELIIEVVRKCVCSKFDFEGQIRSQICTGHGKCKNWDVIESFFLQRGHFCNIWLKSS